MLKFLLGALSAVVVIFLVLSLNRTSSPISVSQNISVPTPTGFVSPVPTISKATHRSTWTVTHPQAIFTPSTPNSWKRLTHPTAGFSFAYDPGVWTDMAYCSMSVCTLSTKIPQFLTYSVFSEPFTSPTPQQQLQSRYGKGNFVDILVDNYPGVMSVYQMPMESGGNKLIAGIVVKGNLVIFVAEIRDEGTYTLNYAHQILGTMSF